MKVLVVDDDPDYRTMLRMQLEIRHQIDVIGEAGDGNEALAFLEAATPEAIVLDLMMPGMDGYETIVHLRERFPELPVVAYTAVTGQSAQEHCDRHGVPLLRKSGDTSGLVAMLREAVDRAGEA